MARTGKKRSKRGRQKGNLADSPSAAKTTTKPSAVAQWKAAMRGKGYALWGLSHVPVKVRVALWISIVALAPFYSVFQGIDLTDVGRAVVDYRNFFVRGDYATTSSWVYLSAAISGIWMAAFNNLGFVAIKLGNVAMSWGSAGFAYWGLRRSFGRERTLAAVAVASCFINARSLVQWINYDTTSGLFYTAGVAFLIRGLKGRSQFLIGVAGFTFLLLKYVRFSSLLGMGFVLAVPLYYWLHNQDWQAMKKDLMAYGVGLAAGLLFMAGIGLATGAPLVIPRSAPAEEVVLADASASDVTDSAAERKESELAGYGYGVKDMAARLLRQYWAGTKKSIPIILGIIVLAALIVRFPRAGPAVLLGVGIFAYTWLFPKDPVCHFVNSMLAAFLGISLLVLGKRAPTQSTIIFLAFCILACSPAGSNTGLAKASHGMWFAIPVFLLCPFRWRDVRIGKLRLHGRPFAAASLIAGLMILGGSIFLGWHNSYRDHPHRSKMNTQVDHPKLRWLWTTPQRAEALRDLLDNYAPHIAEDELMLTIGSAPGLHYIMERKTYLANPWTEQLYDPHFRKPLLQGELAWADAKAKYDGAPVLVIARGNCRSAVWPLSSKPPPKPQPLIKIPGDERIYKLAWAGKFFLIYRPRDGKVAKVKPDSPPS
jgi:hypothetical protein